MNKIFILGAFDRFNYGDLLFPLIIDKAIIEPNKIDFEMYICSLKDKDYSKLGGVKTQGLAFLYRNIKQCPNSVIIIAGGEVLGVNWATLYYYLNKRFGIIRHIFNKLHLINVLNKSVRFMLTGKTNYPFIIDKRGIFQSSKVIYNSVGGGHTLTEIKAIEELKDADYLTVRDNKSVINLNKFQVDAQAVPDSAILMSSYYDKKKLETNSSLTVYDYSIKTDYVFFQVSLEVYKINKTQIISLIKQLLEEFKVNVCLCPIGTAPGHENDIALRDIYETIKRKNCILFENVSVWDIMLLISNSKCYIGTSLHGTITAMSFSIPYMGIKSIGKIKEYLATWSFPPLSFGYSFDTIYENFQSVLKTSKIDLDRNKQLQKGLVLNSFNKIISLIKS